MKRLCVFHSNRLIIVQGLLVFLLLLKPGTWQGATRNRAFVMLTKCLLAPSASPTDSRARTASELFDSLSQQDPERYQAYSIRLQGMTRQLLSLPNRQYYNGRRELQRACEAEALGNWDAAISHYHRAITSGTEQIGLEANLLLAKLLQAQGNVTGFEQAMQTASGVSLPLFVSFDGCPDLELLGGYVDERDLELNRPVHIVLVWRTVQGRPVLRDDIDAIGGNSKWRFVVWQDQIFQLGLVENLVPDGGFERVVLPYSGIPIGYSSLAAKEEHFNPALVYKEATRGEDMMLAMEGTNDTYIGLRSSLVDVQTGGHSIGYLVVGEYRSTANAKVQVGIRWLLKGATFQDNISSHAVCCQSSTEWTRFARLAVPPDNADKVRLWIVELNGLARLYVDNLALFHVPLPCSTR